MSSIVNSIPVSSSSKFISSYFEINLNYVIEIQISSFGVNFKISIGLKPVRVDILKFTLDWGGDYK